MRIVSLVPSLSRTLVDFGLQEAIVGCTQFCISPPSLRRTATAVGGTKNPDLEIIEHLKPTHIFMNYEENRKEDFESLSAKYSCYVSYTNAPREVPELIQGMGQFLGMESITEPWHVRISTQLQKLAVSTEKPMSCLYFIWKSPYMVTGPNTYIDAMLQLTGFQNIAPDRLRYPQLDISEIRDLDPSHILLSSEPYPFRKRDARQLHEETGIGEDRFFKIDGMLMSWYGTTTARALEAIMAWRSGQSTSLIKKIIF